MQRFAIGPQARSRIIIAVAVCLATVLIAATALGRSIATDEAFTWGIVAQPTMNGFWDGLRFVGGNMAAYFVLLRPLAALGDSVFWLRLPSLLCAVGTIVLLAEIGRTWFDEAVARRVAWLAATSVPLLYYGAEMRSYAFVALMTTWLWSLVGRALDQDKPRLWWLAGLACALMVSGHVISALMLPGIGLIVMLESQGTIVQRARRLIPIGLGVLPTAALIAVGDGAKTEWIPALDIVSVARAGRFLLGDHAQFTDQLSGPALVLVYTAVFTAAAVMAVRSRDDRRPHDVRIWIWFLGLPITIVIVSLIEPLLWHRYLIPALPGALLVAARALGRIDRRIAAATLLLIAVLGVGRTIALRPHSADEYEQLAAAIEDAAAPGDVLLANPQWSRAGLDYYWRTSAPVVGNPLFGPGFDRGDGFAGFESVDGVEAFWVVERSDSSQVRITVERTDDDFMIDELFEKIADDYAVDTSIEIQRFRAWRFVRR